MSTQVALFTVVSAGFESAVVAPYQFDTWLARRMSPHRMLVISSNTVEFTSKPCVKLAQVLIPHPALPNSQNAPAL
jgi:hypothetical protein